MIHAMGPRRPIAERIADKVCDAEVAFQFALTKDWSDAYAKGWEIYHLTLEMLKQPDRPAVWPRGSEPR